jgi:hypothetical protein
MPEADYHSHPAMSMTKLGPFMDCTPFEAHYREMHPKAPTEALELGSAVHAAMLEPERFRSDWVVAPKFDRRTTDGKRAWASFVQDNIGKELITAEQKVDLDGMIKAVEKSVTASALLRAPGPNEISFFWADPDSGISCRARADRIVEFRDYQTIVDPKTTARFKADNRGFQKACVSFKYHCRAAFYLDGLNEIAPRPRRYVFVVLETSPPYQVACYELDVPFEDYGRDQYKRALIKYAECAGLGVWPSYIDDVDVVEAPYWMRPPEE